MKTHSSSGWPEATVSMHISEYECAVACWVPGCELNSVYPTSVSRHGSVYGTSQCLYTQEQCFLALRLQCPHAFLDPTDHSEFYPTPHSENKRLALYCISSRVTDTGVTDCALLSPTPFHPWSLSFSNCHPSLSLASLGFHLPLSR